MIDYDSLLNGGQYVPVDMVSAVDQSPKTVPTPGIGVGMTSGSVANGKRASTQTIVLVWLVLLVLLVMAHVFTLSLQR